MPYAGKQLIQRTVVDLVNVQWPNRKVEATATFGAESHYYLGAWHDNLDANGNVMNRDCGLCQNDINLDQIGTPEEFRLRTESLIEAEYMDVARYCIQVARWKYDEPWMRGSIRMTREWEPWVAYTSGWALYPEAWVWHHIDGTPQGKPIGPWVPTGRYLHKAIQGVANWHLLIAKDLNGQEALAEAERLAGLYKITKGELVLGTGAGVTWRYPNKPVDPPADPQNEYPQRNNGQSFLSSLA